MSRETKLWFIVLLLFVIGFSVTITKANYATYYADKFHGRKTASGEIFNQNAKTCASNKYKFGTRLKVTNIANGKAVICRVNDTGKFGRSVVVDLSKGAFAQIAPLKQGKIKVKVEIL